MRKLSCGTALLLLVGGMAWAQAVTVYDVGVMPDSSNKKVAVTYRLAATNAGVATVAMDISSDAGGTWTVPANTYYPGSDIGPGIPANGSLRQLIWDARVDWNQQYSTQMMVRLEATVSEQQSGLYYFSNGSLYRMNLDGSGAVSICSGLPKCELLAVDAVNHRIFLSTWHSGAILSCDLMRGGDASVLYNGPGSGGGQGLAYDPATRWLFNGQYYNGVFGLNEQTGKGWTRLVSVPSLSPMIGQRGQLELDPENQHLYFRSAYNGDCDQCRWIWRVNYDGTGLTQVMRANGGDAMVLDLSAKHIYFSDEPGNGAIYRANLDGSGLQPVMVLSGKYQFCRTIKLDLAGGKMYMNLLDERNWRDHAVARASLDGSDFELLREYPNNEGGGFALFLR